MRWRCSYGQGGWTASESLGCCVSLPCIPATVDVALFLIFLSTVSLGKVTFQPYNSQICPLVQSSFLWSGCIDQTSHQETTQHMPTQLFLPQPSSQMSTCYHVLGLCSCGPLPGHDLHWCCKLRPRLSRSS